MSGSSCHGSNASPGWSIKVINEAIKGVEHVATYLNDVIILDFDPTAHVKTMCARFVRLRKHNLKLSPSKARLGATDVDFWATPFHPRVCVRTRKMCQH